MIKLEDVKISEYIELLKTNSDSEKLKEIEKQLSSELSGTGSGMDLALFMLQKDLLLFECKLVKSVFDFDKEKEAIYKKKVQQLKDQLKDKLKKYEKTNPYKSFLQWILTVEKYLGVQVNRSEDLIYLTEATKQMLNSYESQKAQIEEMKSKKVKK